jgi:plasmid stability protein
VETDSRVEIIDDKMISLMASDLEVSMAALTVRNLPEETHRALRLRAAQNGRSTEAEVRMILEEAVRPESRTKIGSVLAAFGQRMGGADLNIARDESPPRAASFE